MKTNDSYCYIYTQGKQKLYTYSEKALELIYGEIKKDPESIIQNLKNNIKK
jgi:hypothetical protein